MTIVGQCRLEAVTYYGDDRRKSKLAEDALVDAGLFLEKLPKSGFKSDKSYQRKLQSNVYEHLLAQNYQPKPYGFGPIAIFFFWFILRQILMWVARIIVQKLLDRLQPSPENKKDEIEDLDLRII